MRRGVQNSWSVVVISRSIRVTRQSGFTTVAGEYDGCDEPSVLLNETDDGSFLDATLFSADDLRVITFFHKSAAMILLFNDAILWGFGDSGNSFSTLLLTPVLSACLLGS